MRYDDPRMKKLYEYRKKRVFLHKDDKILLSWNSWTIIAMAACRTDYLATKNTERPAEKRTAVYRRKYDG